ncbi:MAG: hypothetical protein OXG92_08345 [Chloroflexi bacterium]|nr:hypothetical protein [Chloroflexota bacterium]MCY3583287.1 hypothetical protein [Chloroflexota bacterium]MCY3716459.1 hypothetical protein [Chloroflexota bacterium]MDE2651715.1 hypothetical protein [Chloroflexota bacterium]MXV93861.1 hypothetical protein [Chloroflexota bacterium]
MRELNHSQVASGVFFIGLGLLFVSDYWFPGIFFVIAASKLAGAYAKGERWQAQGSAFWMIAIGLAFALPPVISSVLGIKASFVALLCIGLGLLMIFSKDCRPQMPNKRKVDDGIIDV